MKLLQNRVVFITEADHPSGTAMMARLSVEGADFVLNSASGGEAILPAIKQCEALGSKVVIIQVDLSRSDETTEALERTAAEVGPVDILIHNNNLIEHSTIEHGEEAWFKRMMNANAKTAFIATQAAGKQMVAAGSGKVIYVSSIHAEKPTGSSFAYSAAKGAVKMLAREAALKLGRHGITVNTIEFGPVDGDDEAFRSNISTLYEDYQYKVPDAFLGTYDDLAELALFLSSNQSRYLNGADIRMDGGFLMHYLDGKMKKP